MCRPTTGAMRPRPRAFPRAILRPTATTVRRPHDGGPSYVDEAARRRGDGEVRHRRALHAGGRHRGRARPRPRGDRGDHQLHQHVEPVGHDRSRHPRSQRGRQGPAIGALGQDVAGARARRWSPSTSTAPASPSRSRRSASTSSATAAPPASATPARSSPEISEAVGDADLAVVSVLSGNRNFEGRINPDVKMNYLASPPLCVAYALAGTMDIDILAEPLGSDEQGKDVYLKDIWPSEQEIAQTIGQAVRADMFRKSYGEVFAGDERWNGLRGAGRRALLRGMSAPPTCACRPTSRTCPRRPSRSPTCAVRVCSRCSATASPPTTSPRPDRSSATGPRAPTCRSSASRRRTSTPTARAAATTR